MASHPSKSILLNDVKIIFRNFAGLEKGFDNKGDRNFTVVLEPDLAERMKADGWRVKQLKPRRDDEDDTPGDYTLKVKLNYDKGRPPQCVMITSRGATDLGAGEIGMFDGADIEKADLLVNGWWSDMNNGGYSGYLEKAFITIREDELSLRYADLLDAGKKADADEDD